MVRSSSAAGPSEWERVVHLNEGRASMNMNKLVRIGDRVVPRLIEVDLPGIDGHPRLEFTIDSTDGVPRVTRALIERVEGGREVEAKDLETAGRRLPQWREDIVSLCVSRVRSLDGGQAIQVGPADEADFIRARKDVGKIRAESKRRITPEFLDRVADVYNGQERGGLRAVEAAFGVAERTAAKYIKRAREAGLIPEKESD